MSPEQISGATTVDARTDVYSLGCVLYEMLSGQPPFVEKSAQALLGRKLNDPPPALRSVRPSVPEGLEGIVRKTLGTAPADRYANARELSEALRICEMADQAGRPEPRLTLKGARGPLLVAAFALVALVLAGLLIAPGVSRWVKSRRSVANPDAPTMPGTFVRLLSANPAAGTLLQRSALRKGVPVRLLVDFGYVDPRDPREYGSHWVHLLMLSFLYSQQDSSGEDWVGMEARRILDPGRILLQGTLNEKEVFDNRITLKAWSMLQDTVTHQGFSTTTAMVRVEYPVESIRP